MRVGPEGIAVQHKESYAQQTDITSHYQYQALTFPRLEEQSQPGSRTMPVMRVALELKRGT